MTAPVRIQLSRKKGWRMPAGTVSVARPWRWGNPFIVGETHLRPYGGAGGPLSIFVEDAAHAVRLYRRFLSQTLRIEARVDLAGKNLACWCPPGRPCHADVLLKIANP